MIRNFQKQDAEQVMKLWLEGNKEAHSFIPKDYWEANLEMVQEQLLQAEVYVYEAENRIQGFIGLQEDYISGIFVKQECRSTGIGKQLLEHVKARHAVLTLHVYQQNQRAVAFYRREGFSVIAEEIESETGEINYTMRWQYAKIEEENF